MLANEWMEAGLIGGSLRMPVPGRVLKVIIDYLYTDEAPSVKGKQISTLFFVNSLSC